MTTACLYVKIDIDFGLKMPDPASLLVCEAAISLLWLATWPPGPLCDPDILDLIINFKIYLSVIPR
jgi:hypothetical protein